MMDRPACDLRSGKELTDASEEHTVWTRTRTSTSNRHSRLKYDGNDMVGLLNEEARLSSVRTVSSLPGSRSLLLLYGSSKAVALKSGKKLLQL